MVGNVVNIYDFNHTIFGHILPFLDNYARPALILVYEGRNTSSLDIRHGRNI
jgi:hypothetical protein